MKVICNACGTEYEVNGKHDVQDTCKCPECGEVQELYENSR